MGNGRRRKGRMRGRGDRREKYVRETEGHNDEKEVRGSRRMKENRGRVKYVQWKGEERVCAREGSGGGGGVKAELTC
jgi:hypothetical protein